MPAHTSNLKTTELLDLYPTLRFPNTPYTCKSVWDRRQDEWFDAMYQSPEWYRSHDDLMQVRNVLIAHHKEVSNEEVTSRIQDS